MILLKILVAGLFGYGTYDLSSKALAYNSQPDYDVLVVDTKTLINLEGIIVSGMPQKQQGYYSDVLFNTRVNQIKHTKSKLINVRINSVGGDVVAGAVILERMRAEQAKGYTFRCFVDGIAMSMAVPILTECDERYTTKKSIFMWHRGTIVGEQIVIKLDELEQLVEQLNKLDKLLWANTRGYFPEHFFDKHLKNETLLKATTVIKNSFKYIKPVNGIRYHP